MSLRRSQRGRRPAFNVGDVVEIMRPKGLSTAQLLHKVDDARWLVTFDAAGVPDEEISEKSFGRLVQSAEDQAGGSASSTSGDNGSTRQRGRGGDRRSKTRRGASSPGASDEGNSRNRRRRGASASHRQNAEDPSENARSRGFKRGAAAANLADSPAPTSDRKRRRGVRRETGITTRARVKNGQASALPESDLNGYQSPPKITGRGGRRGGTRPKQNPGEKVVKVEMLTGTLYLYRGENRRAEFVRHF